MMIDFTDPGLYYQAKKLNTDPTLYERYKAEVGRVQRALNRRTLLALFIWVSLFLSSLIHLLR
jgi:hypothetical protein